MSHNSAINSLLNKLHIYNYYVNRLSPRKTALVPWFLISLFLNRLVAGLHV